MKREYFNMAVELLAQKLEANKKLTEHDIEVVITDVATKHNISYTDYYYLKKLLLNKFENVLMRGNTL